jgi:hypothetical protein
MLPSGKYRRGNRLMRHVTADKEQCCRSIDERTDHPVGYIDLPFCTGSLGHTNFIDDRCDISSRC